LYGFVRTWPFILRKTQIESVENRALWRIFGPKREGVSNRRMEKIA
jgi:hypothetical protein